MSRSIDEAIREAEECYRAARQEESVEMRRYNDAVADQALAAKRLSETGAALDAAGGRFMKAFKTLAALRAAKARGETTVPDEEPAA